MPDDASDDELLTASDAASFERFYVRHVDAVLGYFARRTRDPELAADLCAETFAAALASRHRFHPARRPRRRGCSGSARRSSPTPSGKAMPRTALGDSSR